MFVRVGFCRAALGAALLAAVSGVPRSALADSSSAEKAAAEALFDDGLKLLRAKQYAEACRKLETSERIDPAVGTLLYLAECYEQLGRTASAWATFREAGSLAQSSGQSERAKVAAQRSARLESELSYLVINVAPEAQVPGLVVTRAGEAVSPGLFGVSIPADPGDVLVEATAPGHSRFTTHVALAVHDKRSVTIPAFPEAAQSPAAPTEPTGAQPAPAVAPPPSTPVAPAPAPEPQHKSNRTLAYALGAGGIVGLGVGTYFGLHAIDRNKAAKKTCSGTTCSDQNGVDLTNSARSSALVSDVAFVAGGALLAGAIVAYVLTAPKSHEASALHIRPEIGMNSVGLSLTGAIQ